MLTTKAYVAGRHFGSKSNASRGHSHRAATGQARGLDDGFAGLDVLPPLGYEGWGENELPSEFQAPEYESHHVVLDESEYINRLAEM